MYPSLDTFTADEDAAMMGLFIFARSPVLASWSNSLAGSG
jgi:hypothetical protein